MAISGLVMTPGPQMDPEKPVVDHLILQKAGLWVEGPAAWVEATESDC